MYVFGHRSRPLWFADELAGCVSANDAATHTPHVGRLHMVQLAGTNQYMHAFKEVYYGDLHSDKLPVLSKYLAPCLRGRPNSVHHDATELDLVALAGEGEEELDTVHGGLEVRKKLLLGGMSGRTNGADTDELDWCGSSLEKTGETLHDEVEVSLDVLVEDLD